MVNAIVLIKVTRGRVPEVADALLELPEVAEVYSVTGENDLVAVVRVKEYDQMAELVPAKIDRIQGVERTNTMMAFRIYSRHDLEYLFSLGADEELRYRRAHSLAETRTTRSAD
jgi:DNA-binding Lrp family transcriptional regulator